MAKPVRIALFCECGDTLVGYAPPKGVDSLMVAWRTVHHGIGHTPCDSKASARARRRRPVPAAKGVAK